MGLTLRDHLQHEEWSAVARDTDTQSHFDGRFFCGLFLRFVVDSSLLPAHAVRVLSYWSGIDGGCDLGAWLRGVRRDIEAFAALDLRLNLN